MISGSTHPRLTSEWSGEVDIAGSLRDLDHSWFVFDKKAVKFETLDSDIAKGIMKIIPAGFERMINFLEGTQYKNKLLVVTGWQIMHYILSFFNMNKTQGRTMNLSVLLNVELYNE